MECRKRMNIGIIQFVVEQRAYISSASSAHTSYGARSRSQRSRARYEAQGRCGPVAQLADRSGSWKAYRGEENVVEAATEVVFATNNPSGAAWRLAEHS
jgi:hypothetical protein